MIKSFADTVDSTTIEERRRLLRTIVKKVVWDGKNVYVYLFAEDGELNLPPIGQLVSPSGEVSLNDSLDSDADGESLYLMDVVGVEDTMYLDIQDRDDCLRVRRLVHECLTEREEEVITSRYGLGGRMPRTQREVAKKLGISRSYVSRIEKRALQKLEEALGERE